MYNLQENYWYDKKLFRNLCLTFVFSLLLTVVLYLIWLRPKEIGYGEEDAKVLLIVGSIFHNLILAVSALPIFLLKNSNLFNNAPLRLLVYFEGPVTTARATGSVFSYQAFHFFWSMATFISL